MSGVVQCVASTMKLEIFADYNVTIRSVFWMHRHLLSPKEILGFLLLEVSVLQIPQLRCIILYQKGHWWETFAYIWSCCIAYHMVRLLNMETYFILCLLLFVYVLSRNFLFQYIFYSSLAKKCGAKWFLMHKLKVLIYQSSNKTQVLHLLSSSKKLNSIYQSSKSTSDWQLQLKGSYIWMSQWSLSFGIWGIMCFC